MRWVIETENYPCIYCFGPSRSRGVAVRTSVQICTNMGALLVIVAIIAHIYNKQH
jgi:hypothetical protein